MRNEHISRIDIPSDLVEILEELTNEFNSTGRIELDSYIERAPEHASGIRRFASAIEVMSQLEVEPDEDDSQPTANLQRETLGDFHLLREIGRGGMGVVYEAEQRSLGRLVAVKILPFAHLMDQRHLERFKNEARAASMLRHPHIVNVFQVGCERGVYFYAMDLVEGVSIADLVRELSGGKESRQRSDPRQVDAAAETTRLAAISTEYVDHPNRFFKMVANLGVQAAEALHFAHEQGVIHRDIKPSNLLLDRDGQVYVTDFGLARIVANENLTMSGDVVGTLRYMSPEQAAGSSVIDQRTDVYSLGLTLYELVTGQQTYPATDQHQLLLQLRDAVPERPSKLDSRVPRDLETIILKAIEKDPRDRYDSANDMADDLRQFISQRPIRARRASRWEHIRRWMMRNPRVATLAAAIAVLLLAVAIGSSQVAIRASALAKQHEKGLYARDIRLAQQAVHQGRMLDAEALLLNWVANDPTADHRRIEWYHLWEAAHDPAIRRSIKHQVSALAVRFQGQDNKLAVGWLSNKISIWDLHRPVGTGPERELTGPNIGVFNLEVVREGDLLIAGDTSGHVATWDVATGQPKWETDVDLPATTAMGFSFAASSDQALVALGAGRYTSGLVQVHDLETGECLAMSPRYPGRCWADFLPSGQLIVGAMNHPFLDVYEPKSMRRLQQYPIRGDGVTALLVARRRQHLLALTHKRRGTQFVSELEVRDATSMKQIRKISIGSSLADCLAISPAEDRLAAGNEAGYLYFFDERYDVELEKRVHAGMVSDLTFSADGRSLATTGNDSFVHVWDVPRLLAGEPYQVEIQADVVDVQGVGFLDATTAWTATADGSLFCWDARTGQIRTEYRVTGSAANLSRTAVSPSRKLAGIVRAYWPRRDAEAKIEVLDLEEGEVVRSIIVPHGSPAGQPAFSADGRYFAACLDNHLLVLDLDSPSAEGSHELDLPHEIKSLAFSPDGRRLMCADAAGFLQCISLPAFTLETSCQVENALAMNVAFSSNGQQLAVVGFDRCIHLFESQRFPGRSRNLCATPTYQVDLDFSPDGQRVVTAGPDGKVRLWDMTSGEELLNFTLRDGWYPRCEFSPDGTAIAVGSGQRAFVVRSADPTSLSRLSVSQLRDIACQHLNQR